MAPALRASRNWETTPSGAPTTTRSQAARFFADSTIKSIPQSCTPRGFMPRVPAAHRIPRSFSTCSACAPQNGTARPSTRERTTASRATRAAGGITSWPGSRWDRACTAGATQTRWTWEPWAPTSASRAIRIHPPPFRNFESDSGAIQVPSIRTFRATSEPST